MSEEKKPYIVLEAYKIRTLEEMVLLLLNQGYVPLGGVCVVSRAPIGMLGGESIFYQAMVFNEV